jgi:hypothetical protein
MALDGEMWATSWTAPGTGDVGGVKNSSSSEMAPTGPIASGHLQSHFQTATRTRLTSKRAMVRERRGEVQNPPKCWSLGWKCRSEGRLQPLNGKRRTLRPHVRTVVTCGEFCNVRRVQYRFDRRPRLTDGGLKSLFYVSGTCYCRRGWPGNERLLGMAPPPRVLFEPTRFVVYL